MVETSVILPPDYKPSADEEYMNEMQVEYFRQKLLDWKKSLLAQSQDTLEIGVERLEARPVATLSIEAQERHERMEKTYSED